MGDQLAHSDQVTHLMETVACDHVFMDPGTAHAATIAAVESLTLDEVNEVARDLCAHVLDFGRSEPMPSAIVACAPAKLSDGTPVEISNEKLLAVAERAQREPIAPEPELVVPKTLMTEKDIANLKPGSVDVVDPNGASRVGAYAAKLENGARVVVKPLKHEAQRGAVRITAAGGTSVEKFKDLCKPGSVTLGARTLQEGGAFEPWTREQVELFCVDRLIMVEVSCHEEAIHIDFQFPTPAPRDNEGCGGLTQGRNQP